MQRLLDSPAGSSLYFKKKNDDEGGPLSFERHFNSSLASDSHYFKNLDKLLKCVEKHADVSIDRPDKVCYKEYKQLRLDALNNQLMYHNVNKRFF